MTFEDFKDSLQALASLEMHDLIEAGVFQPHDLARWNAFRLEPLRWILRSDSDTIRRIWFAVQSRTKSTAIARHSATGGHTIVQFASNKDKGPADRQLGRCDWRVGWRGWTESVDAPFSFEQG